MRKQPKARTTKSKSRIDDFFEIKKKAHQRRKDHKVQLLPQVKASLVWNPPKKPGKKKNSNFGCKWCENASFFCQKYGGGGEIAGGSGLPP